MREFGKPLAVETVDRPQVGDGQVLVKVRAAGVCGTDVKLSEGLTEPPPSLPHVPGHEIAGEVAIGTAGFEVGEPIACHIVSACGRCGHCRRGYPVFCAEACRLGLDEPGGMAELVAVDQRQVLPIGDIPFAQAAVAMDSVTTPWHALHVTGELRSGERLLVVGVGGLGANAIQLGVAAGARVAAVDVEPSRLDAARRLGASLAVEPSQADAVLAWADGGVDISVELSGKRAGFELAAGLLRPGGRVVCCGYAPGTEYGMDSARLVLQNIRILGSRNLTLDDARAALDAIASGAVTPDIARVIGMEEVNEALDLLRTGSAGGRVVIDPQL